MELVAGDRVKHPTLPAWGLGEIVEVGERGRIRVFFTGIGEKRLVMPHVKLTLVTGDEAEHMGLDNLRTEPANQRIEYRTMEVLIETFLEHWPGGFENPEYLEKDRAPKIAASELLAESLSRPAIDELVNDENWKELSKRVLASASKTNMVYPNEKQALKQALSSPQEAKFFADKFKSLLYGKRTPEVRFNDFVDCLERLKAPKWPLATYYQFLADPVTNMVLKPRFTQQAADSCRFEIGYDAFPNWETYSGLMRFANYVGLCLEELKPKDMFDIQSFIWKIAQGA